MSKANGPEWGFKSATISKPFESTHDEDLRALHSQGASADITMTRELHGSDVSNTPVGNVDLSTLEGLPEAIARGSASSSPQAVEPIPNIPIRTAGSVQSPSSVTANQAKTAATHGTTGPTASTSTLSTPPVVRFESSGAAPFVPFSTPNAVTSPSSSETSTLPTLSNTQFGNSFPQARASNMTFLQDATSHRRRTMATTPALTEYEADLTSKDRMKQKDAIKSILAAKVRTDWDFPKQDDYVDLQVADALPDADSEGALEWTERADWASEVSEGEEVGTPKAEAPEKPRRTSFFRSHSQLESVGETLRQSVEKRKLRRQKRLNAELDYNEGLRCFVARRNAWTGAKRVKHRRGNAPLALHTAGDASKSPARPESHNEEKDGNEADSEDEEIVDTFIPIAPPMLPPSTPMRKNMTSRAYGTIYDKVILQSQTPFCPINLATVVNSCVHGWKRDGEWPPKGTEPDAFLSRRKAAPNGSGQTSAAQKGVFRRSLNRVFGGGGNHSIV